MRVNVHICIAELLQKLPTIKYMMNTLITVMKGGGERWRLTPL